METDKCISTSSAATSKNQLTINDLDDYSLSMIFNKLPYIERMLIGRVCQHWYSVSEASWCVYSKHLTIGKEILSLCYNINKKYSILTKILQCSGPYLEEIILLPKVSTHQSFSWITIKLIGEHCPKLKRLTAFALKLNAKDWLACSNLEALSFFSFERLKGGELDLLFRRNKRLRRLEILNECLWTDSEFDHLDPGQLESLHVEYCDEFELTAKVADKLAESLVEFSYSATYHKSKLQHLGKLRNLRSLDLRVGISSLETEFIDDITKNCRKLERLFLIFRKERVYNTDVFAPLFDLAHLKRLVLIVEENDVAAVRDRFLQMGSHLEFFLIDACFRCTYGLSSFDFCKRHPRGGQRNDELIQIK